MSAVRAIECPNCGASVELRGFSHSLSAVCTKCLSVLDASSSTSVKVLQRFSSANAVNPLIPLGTRGQFEGRPFEILGFQVRRIEVEGVSYFWQEYLLFNPYAGFRYLSEYGGHWNYITPVKGLPNDKAAGAVYAGQRYRHFQTSAAATAFAIGEFPWRVKAGDNVRVDDFVAPPFSLSKETIADEITWSKGVYKTGAEIAEAFRLKAPLPAAQGVYSNQPNPYSAGSMWSVSLWLLILLFAATLFFSVTSGGNTVFRDRYYYGSTNAEEAMTTKIFQVAGPPRNVEIETRTDIGNTWIYFNMSLVNADTGQVWSFGREVDNTDGDGTRNDNVILPAVPAGQYFLRIEPEMAPGATAFSPRLVNYEIEVKRNVPRYWLFWLAVPIVLIPPFLRLMAKASFETRRWQESDYAS